MLFSWAVYNIVKEVAIIIVIFIVSFIISIAFGMFLTKKQIRRYDQTSQREAIVSISTGNIQTFIVYYIASALAFAW